MNVFRSTSGSEAVCTYLKCKLFGHEGLVACKESCQTLDIIQNVCNKIS
jgi:hypothetical protein